MPDFRMYSFPFIIIIIIIIIMYPVPENLEITNKEKKQYNGCNGLAGSERALKWDRVPPLQCYGHLLEQVGGLSVVACDVCRPSSDLNYVIRQYLAYRKPKLRGQVTAVWTGRSSDAVCRWQQTVRWWRR